MSCKQCEQLGKQLQDAWEKILELDKKVADCMVLRRRLEILQSAPLDDRTLMIGDVLDGIEESGEPTLEPAGESGEEGPDPPGEGEVGTKSR